jgi:hypothetical protein
MRTYGCDRAAVGRHAGMVFVADDLAAWLIFILAETGRKRLTTLGLGGEQKRALQSAATVAVQRTAAELQPGDEKRAEHLAMVVSQVFGEPGRDEPRAGRATVLEALQAGVARHLVVLDDADLTGTGRSSADLLGVPGAVVTQKLTTYLLQEIMSRGLGGGPLEPLSNQLNHDKSYLQGLRVEHTFRFFKQVLGWTAPKIRDPAAADRWTWLIIAVYAQLRLARPLAADLRRPWERPAPPGRLTPAGVRRGFRNIRAKATQPASAPKPGKPGPGRPPGSKNRHPALRHDVGKTTKRELTLKAHHERAG